MYYKYWHPTRIAVIDLAVLFRPKTKSSHIERMGILFEITKTNNSHLPILLVARAIFILKDIFTGGAQGALVKL